MGDSTSSQHQLSKFASPMIKSGGDERKRAKTGLKSISIECPCAFRSFLQEQDHVKGDCEKIKNMLINRALCTHFSFLILTN